MIRYHTAHAHFVVLLLMLTAAAHHVVSESVFTFQFNGYCENEYYYPEDNGDGMALSDYTNKTDLKKCYDKCVQKNNSYIVVYHTGEYKNKCYCTVPECATMKDVASAKTYNFTHIPSGFKRQFNGYCKDNYGYPEDGDQPTKLSGYSDTTQFKRCYNKCIEKNYKNILVYHRGGYKNKCYCTIGQCATMEDTDDAITYNFTSTSSPASKRELCTNECASKKDNRCDDGGIGAEYAECAYGSDCTDCGSRNLTDVYRQSFGQCKYPLSSLAACQTAGDQLSLGMTAKDDQNEASNDDPTGCYAEGSKSLFFHVKNTNTGSCNGNDVCVCGAMKVFVQFSLVVKGISWSVLAAHKNELAKIIAENINVNANDVIIISAEDVSSRRRRLVSSDTVRVVFKVVVGNGADRNTGVQFISSKLKASDVISGIISDIKKGVLANTPGGNTATVEITTTGEPDPLNVSPGASPSPASVARKDPPLSVKPNNTVVVIFAVLGGVIGGLLLLKGGLELLKYRSKKSHEQRRTPTVEMEKYGDEHDASSDSDDSRSGHRDGTSTPVPGRFDDGATSNPLFRHKEKRKSVVL